MDPNGKMMGLQLILAGVLAKTIQREGGMRRPLLTD